MANKKTKLCVSCKNPFEGRADAKTCSPACRKLLQRLQTKLRSKAYRMENELGKGFHRLAAELFAKHTVHTPLVLGDERGAIEAYSPAPLATPPLEQPTAPVSTPTPTPVAESPIPVSEPQTSASIPEKPATTETVPVRVVAPPPKVIAPTPPTLTVAKAASPVINTPTPATPIIEPQEIDLDNVPPEPSFVEGANAARESASPRFRGFSLFGFNKLALAASGAAVLVVLLIGAAGMAFLSSHNRGQLANEDGKQAANYPVGNLSVDGVKQGELLKAGDVSQLTVNGQLKVTDSLVLSAGKTPTAPVAGQIYYDRAANAPYYFNGSQFISLAPVAVPQSVTSLGGAAGVIGLGNGLTVNGNQLSIANNVLQAINGSAVNTPRVTSLQGLTGDVTLVAGSGIAISGTTISNNGVISLTQGSDIQITPNGNGNFTISYTGAGPSGTVQLGPSTAQVDASNNSAINIDKTGTGYLLQLASSGVNKFVVDQNGQIQSGTIAYSQVIGAPVSTVTSIAGNSGAFTLGTGLGNSGNQLLNTGVVSITGTANQVIASAATGALTLSLPQDIAQTSVPVFGGALLNGGLTITSGGLLVSGTTSISGTIALNGPTTVSDNVAIQGSNGLTLGVAGTTAGKLSFANSSNAYVGTIQSAVLGQNTTYILPDPGVASVGICLTTGNCAGAGSGITGFGTIGHIAKFDASGDITDSNLTESGTSLTYGGNLIVNAASGFTGNLLNLAVNGSSKLSVDQLGNIIHGGTLTVNGSGTSSIAGTLTVGDALSVANDLTVGGAVQFSSYGAGLLYSDGSGNLA